MYQENFKTIAHYGRILSKLILMVVIFAINIYSQAEYVRIENPVYNFLERMDALNIISGYNKFELPKTRKEISDYLEVVLENKNKLDDADINILGDLEIEFEYELQGTLKNSQSMIGNSYDLFSENEKYLFYHSNPGRANIFINFLTEGQLINHSEKDSANNFAALGIIGGEIRGTFLDKFGFSLRGTNGNAFGDKEAALARKDIRYNYKFNSTPEETFFDETEGYLTADFDIVKFKYGRDRLNIGYGAIKPLLGSSSPLFDYLSLRIKYEFFSFSFFHGKLLGEESFENDSVTGGSPFITEKYMAYHRIGFDLSKHIDFGIGEIIIYGDRPMDMSYLNPFTFYKSIEHANRDRDNSMLFVDINNNSIDGLSVYSTLLIDDITYGKIGTGWWGNEILFNAGLYSANLYGFIPLDVRFDYLHIEPYTFSHRLLRNNFTNYGYNLSSEFEPNSELFSLQFIYRFSSRLIATVLFSYGTHGANPVDNNGNVTRNVGGDIFLGHRVFDSDIVSFMDGEIEYKRNMAVSLSFEPVNLVKIRLDLEIINESLQQNVKRNEVNTFFTMDLKL